ncbi:cytochrome c biogenesis protein [Desulfovibrio sp. OttesenSCG-928-M14]|nr:cytochrome c biogenesis protein [Desulfovibrio sp. OttesenSCG-928-M14]
MDFEKLLFLSVLLLYSLGAFGILLGTLARRPALKRVAHILTLCAFALQSLSLFMVFVAVGPSGLSMGYYMQFLAWCLILLYLAAWRWFRLPFLGLTAAPLALLLYIFSMRLAGVRDILPEHLSGLFFGLHIWSLYISLGLLALAFGAGLLFLYTEGRIKKKAPLAGFTRDMPAISTYDKVNRAAVIGGFPLFTLGLIAGFVWAPMGQRMAESPKVFFSLFVWFLFAVLFYQRTALGMRGRKAAIMVIAIFGIAVLSAGLDWAVNGHHSHMLMP